MNNYLSLTALFALLFSFSFFSYSDSEKISAYKIDTIASGLGVPWGMAVMPNNTLLITQREALLSQVNLKTGKLTSISGLPKDIKVGGQGGLFDIALSPNYSATHWIYFSYNKDVGKQGATTLARAKIENKALVDWQDLLVTQSISNRAVHYGGRISFDNHGHVFLSVGERGVRANGQDLMMHAGSILRLNLDGSTPNDNPFVNNNKILPEVWSYGHRNPQGLFYNTYSQQLWSSEHGPRGGDEINLVRAGHNYGWPIVSHGQEYNAPIAVGEGTERDGIVSPVKTYIPSIATSSLIQYRGNHFPELTGDLLVGALKAQHVNHIDLDENNNVKAENRILRSINGRIRNIIESPEGWLYISTDDGRILKVSCSKTSK
jgi:glucose/arabinose dehydrogenase